MNIALLNLMPFGVGLDLIMDVNLNSLDWLLILLKKLITLCLMKIKLVIMYLLVVLIITMYIFILIPLESKIQFRTIM